MMRPRTLYQPKSGLTVVFTGTYQRSLDGKLRVLLPKRLRAESSNLGWKPGMNLFLTPGTDHCLELHTNDSLNQLAQRASQSPAGSKSVRSFSRLFYARAHQCDIDKQGRIRIPQDLARLADLSKEVVFVGVGFHWELWNLELWEIYLKKNYEAFDEITETTLDATLGSLVHHQVAQPQQPVVQSDQVQSASPSYLSEQHQTKPK